MSSDSIEIDEEDTLCPIEWISWTEDDAASRPTLLRSVRSPRAKGATWRARQRARCRAAVQPPALRGCPAHRRRQPMRSEPSPLLRRIEVRHRFWRRGLRLAPALRSHPGPKTEWHPMTDTDKPVAAFFTLNAEGLLASSLPASPVAASSPPQASAAAIDSAVHPPRSPDQPKTCAAPPEGRDPPARLPADCFREVREALEAIERLNEFAEQWRDRPLRLGFYRPEQLR